MESKLNVWLDDERPMPSEYDTHVKTAEDAIALLESGKVNKISLDHDLGQIKTGYDVAKWIEENAIKGNLKKIYLRVHTQNPVGRKNICAALQNAARHWMKEPDENVPNEGYGGWGNGYGGWDGPW